MNKKDKGLLFALFSLIGLLFFAVIVPAYVVVQIYIEPNLGPWTRLFILIENTILALFVGKAMIDGLNDAVNKVRNEPKDQDDDADV